MLVIPMRWVGFACVAVGGLLGVRFPRLWLGLTLGGLGLGVLSVVGVLVGGGSLNGGARFVWLGNRYTSDWTRSARCFWRWFVWSVRRQPLTRTNIGARLTMGDRRGGGECVGAL